MSSVESPFRLGGRQFAGLQPGPQLCGLGVSGHCQVACKFQPFIGCQRASRRPLSLLTYPPCTGERCYLPWHLAGYARPILLAQRNKTFSFLRTLCPTFVIRTFASLIREQTSCPLGRSSQRIFSWKTRAQYQVHCRGLRPTYLFFKDPNTLQRHGQTINYVGKHPLRPLPRLLARTLRLIMTRPDAGDVSMNNPDSNADPSP